MKKASAFEKVAARCWNVLNEGKPFTPVFVVGTFLIYTLLQGAGQISWPSFALAVVWSLPVFAVYYAFDFPLHLRVFLWLPAALQIWMFPGADFALYALGLGLYIFFTVFFWGTIYYHLRIGTPWTNYRRFWKLVLKNSDSTSGNAQEQLPKVWLLLGLLAWFYAHPLGGMPRHIVVYAVFAACLWLYAWAVHKLLFTWKPHELPPTKREGALSAIAEKVYIVIIDGCRKDRLAEADTPFIDWLRAEGTEFASMETIYPDRTVVCFSSMFTGTYPREHGIKSNMVWRLGVRCESVFDSLRKVGKTGKLLGIAHLVDSFGDDVETVTAVMKNDEADANIMLRAKDIVERHDPDLLIVQLIATDQTGHSRGALYEEYKQKIAEADRHIADFYAWLKARGLLDDAVFIVAADHGQSDGIGGHGHLDEGERYVPFFMAGKGIRKGHLVTSKHSLVSVTPTICRLLGAPLPDKSRGPVLAEAFKEEIR
ncbi:MAG TPA: alkaline phosphatase family protein [Bacilli bacterium]